MTPTSCRLAVVALLCGLLSACVTPLTKQPDAPANTEVVVEEPVVIETVVEAVDECLLQVQQLRQEHAAHREQTSKLEDQVARVNAGMDSLLDRPVPEPVELTACIPDVAVDEPAKDLIGAIEWIYMDPPGRHYRARVDSGAETSSLSAQNLMEFERDGEDWVRFMFDHDGDDEGVEIELPVSRVVLVRQVSSEETQRRPVVEMAINIGSMVHGTEFTLTDRSQMSYPVLLGRAFLRDIYLIDVSRSYIHGKHRP